MKIIVVSDIHGRYERLLSVMDMHKDADALVFLGDGLRELFRADAYSYPFTVYSVRGNCDVFSVFSGYADGATDELELNFEGYRFFALHGHTRQVKSSITPAISEASRRNSDVLLYGHTHIPCETYLPEGTEIGYDTLKKPLYVFNPGSLGASGDGKAHFGIIQIRNGNILFSHGTLE